MEIGHKLKATTGYSHKEYGILEGEHFGEISHDCQSIRRRGCHDSHTVRYGITG